MAGTKTSKRKTKKPNKPKIKKANNPKPDNPKKVAAAGFGTKAPRKKTKKV